MSQNLYFMNDDEKKVFAKYQKQLFIFDDNMTKMSPKEALTLRKKMEKLSIICANLLSNLALQKRNCVIFSDMWDIKQFAKMEDFFNSPVCIDEEVICKISKMQKKSNIDSDDMKIYHNYVMHMFSSNVGRYAVFV